MKLFTKVLKLQILKPGGDAKWKELGQLLRDVRYRVFRLANLAVSENYLAFHMFRTGRAAEFKKATIGELNKRLREMLAAEETPVAQLERFSKNGALPATVCDALSKYKVGAITAPAKWRDVMRGKASLPTFRVDMAIPVRCDKDGMSRLQRTKDGNVELDLMVCLKPYPRVVLKTGGIGGGATAVLERLLDNPSQDKTGYRQRCFEIKFDERDRKWWLFITYDFPASGAAQRDSETIVGVDVGVSCPMYVALSNGHARLGRRQFAALAARVRALQTQVMARRRDMLRGGRASLSQDTARSGRGRKRKLRAIQPLEGRIRDAYTTLNHQLARSVVEFAVNHGATVIQIEDLKGLNETLRGTFLGQRWRYHQLQSFIEYKAKEAGVEIRKVSARFTSRRCSACGYIHAEFDRAFRDANRTERGVTRFKCPKCEFESDPDYNAARNLATVDIAVKIVQQCKEQGIAVDAEIGSLASQT